MTVMNSLENLPKFYLCPWDDCIFLVWNIIVAYSTQCGKCANRYWEESLYTQEQPQGVERAEPPPPAVSGMGGGKRSVTPLNTSGWTVSVIKIFAPWAFEEEGKNFHYIYSIHC